MKYLLNIRLYLSIGISIMVAILVHSQSYTPMSVEGATWFMHYTNNEGEPPIYYAYHISGNVEWNGKEYKKVYFIPASNFQYLPDFHPDWSTVIGYMRDDTLERKVYMAQFVLDNGTDDFCDPIAEEFVLYDFNNSVSDRVGYCEVNQNLLITSDSVDTFFNYSRRFIQLENGWKHIEGVGSNVDLFTAGLVTPGFSSSIIHYCIGEFDLCYFGIPTNTKNPTKNNMKIYPNPAGDKIWIEDDYEFIDATINIYSINNQLIRTIKYSTSDNGLNINFLESGVYIIKIGTNRTLLVKN